MARPDTQLRRTQIWHGEGEFRPVEMRFEPAGLSLEEEGAENARSWGLVLGSLAIHPLYDPTDDHPAGFRVSATECGAAIADFEWLEQAIGFASDLQHLDWSGKREEVEAIKSRPGLREEVVAANRKWEELLRGPHADTDQCC